ncbi:Rna methyltransferase [Globisporangium polare]
MSVVVASAPGAEGSPPVPHSSCFASSKVHIGLPPVADEASPRKDTSPVELAAVRKSSVLSLQDLELKSADENASQLALPPQKKMSMVSRRSSSGFPVSQQEDLNFRVTDRQNRSVIYLPQAHARALEPSPSSSGLFLGAAMMTRPAIARRRSGEPQFESGVLQVQHRTSASGLPLPQLTRRGSTRRSIAETQDSFRENMRRRKSSKYVSTYSPREGSRVLKDNNSGTDGSTGGATGRHHADGHMRNKVQHPIMKTRSCCIL